MGVSSSTLVPAASTPRVSAPTTLTRPPNRPASPRSSTAPRPGVTSPPTSVGVAAEIGGRAAIPGIALGEIGDAGRQRRLQRQRADRRRRQRDGVGRLVGRRLLLFRRRRLPRRRLLRANGHRRRDEAEQRKSACGGPDATHHRAAFPFDRSAPTCSPRIAVILGCRGPAWEAWIAAAAASGAQRWRTSYNMSAPGLGHRPLSPSRARPIQISIIALTTPVSGPDPVGEALGRLGEAGPMRDQARRPGCCRRGSPPAPRGNPRWWRCGCP